MATHGIIVLGVARSGTSVITDVIRRWGAYAGPESDLTAADQWNPRGYWEYEPLKAFNNELLASVGANRNVPPQTSDRLREQASNPEYRGRAVEMIGRMARQSEDRPWVWKDPRLPVLLPFWTQIWSDVTYIATVRNPIDMALSQGRMAGVNLPVDSFPFSASLLVWQRYMLDLLEYTELSKRKLFVEYEQLLREPQATCERLALFLERMYGVTSDGATVRTMAAAIASDFAHPSNASIADIRQATREQRALYSFAKAKVLAPDEPFVTSDFALYPGWHEYLQCVHALFQLRAQQASAKTPLW